MDPKSTKPTTVPPSDDPQVGFVISMNGLPRGSSIRQSNPLRSPFHSDTGRQLIFGVDSMLDSHIVTQVNQHLTSAMAIRSADNIVCLELLHDSSRSVVAYSHIVLNATNRSLLAFTDKLHRLVE